VNGWVGGWVGRQMGVYVCEKSAATCIRKRNGDREWKRFACESERIRDRKRDSDRARERKQECVWQRRRMSYCETFFCVCCVCVCCVCVCVCACTCVCAMKQQRLIGFQNY